MPQWFKDVLMKLIKLIGFKPITDYIIGLMLDQAKKTDTSLDDKGVEVIREILDKKAYSLEEIASIVAIHLKGSVKETNNTYDDLVADILVEVTFKRAYSKEAFIDIVIQQTKAYSATTETPIDDLAAEVLEVILKGIK